MGDVMASYLAKLTGNQYTTNLTTTLNTNSYGCSGGSFGQQLLGSLFNVAAMTACYAVQPGCFGGGGGGGSSQSSQQVAQLTTIVGAYVDADKNLDTAKKNMQTAMDDLDQLNADLEKANNANGDDGAIKSAEKNLKDFKDKYKVDSGENKTNYDAYNNDMQTYNTQKANYDKYQGLQKELSNCDTAGLNISGGNAKATVEKGSVSNSKGNQIELTAGTAVNTLQGKTNDFNITVKDGTGKDVQTFDSPTYELAMTEARRLDTEYQARTARASKYNEIKQKLDAYTSVPDEPIKPDPNDEKYKISDSGNGSMSAEQYDSEVKRLEQEVKDAKNIDSPDYKHTLEEKIKAKKAEIRGTLATKLTEAQNKFDIAKAEYDEVSKQISGIETLNNNAAAAKDSSKSKESKAQSRRGFLGIGRKKSVQQKNYDEAKKVAKQAESDFAATYGVNSNAAGSSMKAAQAKVDQVDIKLDDRYKSI